MSIENPESPSQSLTPAQHAAIKKARELSQTILRNHPEIAQDYQDAKTHYSVIAQKYDIAKQYHITRRVATEAVRLAIKTLIPDENVRSKLAHDHLQESGFKLFREGKGAHSQTSQEHRTYGKLSGDMNVINQTGFYKLSKEDLTAAIRLGHLEAGKSVPWDMLFDPETGISEGEYCDFLMRCPKYQYIHLGKTAIRYKVIAQLLNKKFYGGKEIRTVSSVEYRRFRY